MTHFFPLEVQNEGRHGSVYLLIFLVRSLVVLGVHLRNLFIWLLITDQIKDQKITCSSPRIDSVSWDTWYKKKHIHYQSMELLNRVFKTQRGNSCALNPWPTWLMMISPCWENRLLRCELAKYPSELKYSTWQICICQIWTNIYKNTNVFIFPPCKFQLVKESAVVGT